MSSIKLKGSSSGDVTITVPAAAGTNTVTIPAVTGTLPLSNLDHVTNTPSAKPIIINGAMELWQRGTALASNSGNYAADRFWYVGTSMTSQRSTDAPSGFSYSNKLTYGSADMSIGQPIELPAAGEQGMFIAGQKITIAFYGKVDSGTEAISVVINARNSKFSGTNSTSFSTSSDSATLTTDWQRFTNTFTIPTINANNVILAFELAGIGKTAYFTGIQAELGEFNTTTIPPFQHESYGDSLARCQRYFFKTFAQGTTPAQNVGANNTLVNGAHTAISDARFPSYELPVEMRAAGTATSFNPYAANANLRVPGSSTDVAISSITITTHAIVFVCTSADTGVFHIHFTVDGEL
jgi:hypothetical protein